MNELNMKLDSGQCELFDGQALLEIEVMAEFTGLFYGPWILQSPLTLDAALNDLVLLLQMRKYQDIRPEAAKACIKSI